MRGDLDGYVIFHMAKELISGKEHIIVSELSGHGFRPNHSCHTALSQMQVCFTGAKWFVEGDMKGFFANNASRVSSFGYIMQYSMFKTFAIKYRTSMSKKISKLRINKEFEVSWAGSNEEQDTSLF